MNCQSGAIEAKKSDYWYAAAPTVLCGSNSICLQDRTWASSI